MKITQLSEYDTGMKKQLCKKADEDQKQLININHNKKKLFIIGNYSSGTRWLNYLIIKNTPPNSLYMLRNQHAYLDDNNNVQKNFKHGILTETLLKQKNVVIIYIIRDFDTFLNSFSKNSYDKTIKNGIVLGSNMNVYEWYCHMIETNISLLRNSGSNYIIVNMKQIQETKGESLLKALKTYGFNFREPYEFIDTHTKTKQHNIVNRKHSNSTLQFKRNNTNIENILKNIAQQPEIKISWK